ncbi:MAG: lamin tail domain-containing protein [Nanoarchaeota archaeon]|nr:lamin tail domain-containing protein [Nanoarchaeota archaeon]
MKKVVILLMIVMNLAGAMHSVSGIRINEIMYNPAGDDNNKEFIELFMDSPEDLTGWIISDLASDDTLSLLQYSDSHYALIVEEGFDITGINATVYSAGATIGNNLDNSADEIFFYMPNTTLVASAHYDGSIANNNGRSIEFVDGEWLESIEIGGTPGRENTASTVDINNSEDNSSEECDIKFRVFADKDLYNNSDKVKIDFDISPAQDDYIIEYWVEDLSGRIAKSKYNTTNTNQKSWTPSIEEEDKSFLVKANLHVSCSNQSMIFSSQDLITVIGSPKPSDSSIIIKEIYLGEDDSIEFGKALRIMLDIYKGDESTSTVQAWVEDLDSGDKISDVSKITLYDRFREYQLTVPVQIKNNCDDKYSDGSYTLVVEGFDITETQEVRIEGITSSLCPETSIISKTADKKISYDILGYEEEITLGEEFITEVSINNEDESHDFTLWSYVYRGSRSYSGEREENKVSVHVGPGQTETIELSNVVEEAEPGQYKLKIRVQKNEQKTTTDFTKDITISDRPDALKENKTISSDILALVESKNISGNPNDQNGIEIITGRTVYQSKSKKAESLTIYFIIAALGVLIMIALSRLLRRPKKTTQKL